MKTLSNKTLSKGKKMNCSNNLCGAKPLIKDQPESFIRRALGFVWMLACEVCAFLAICLVTALILNHLRPPEVVTKVVTIEKCSPAAGPSFRNSQKERAI